MALCLHSLPTTQADIFYWISTGFPGTYTSRNLKEGLLTLARTKEDECYRNYIRQTLEVIVVACLYMTCSHSQSHQHIQCGVVFTEMHWVTLDHVYLIRRLFVA